MEDAHLLFCVHFMNFYAPVMIMAGALSVTPVRPYFTCTYVCPDAVRFLNQIHLIRFL